MTKRKSKKTRVKVEVGRMYRAVVHGKVGIVKVLAEDATGGWNVVALATDKRHHISSAKGFLCECNAAGKPVIVKVGKDAEAATIAQDAKTGAKPAKDAAKAEKPAKAKRGEPKPKRPSGLDAAAKVLAEARGPLNTAEMVKRMLEHGLWKTGGKTPAATIYAAIIREIAIKGDKARFRKTERGKFELVK